MYWLLTFECAVMQAFFSVVPNMMPEKEAFHLDVHAFFWRLLQLPLIYVDHAILKRQAVYGDAVAPRSGLQAAKRSSTRYSRQASWACMLWPHVCMLHAASSSLDRAFYQAGLACGQCCAACIVQLSVALLWYWRTMYSGEKWASFVLLYSKRLSANTPGAQQ